MERLNLFTPVDFKEYFPREFQYFSDIIWNEYINYLKNNKVYYKGNFYISLQDNNENNEPNNSPDYWQITIGNIYDYITDNDIYKAFDQAKTSFNINLFLNDVNKMEIAFLLLTAHYLIMDLNMSNGNGVGSFLITSKSVDGVSASYGIPQKYLQNPYYSYFASTSFGMKYLQYLIPLTIGGIYTIRGTTTIT